MGKRVGSPADRLFVYEQIEANSGQAGDSLCDRLRLDLKLKISNRSLRQWHRDTKKAIAKAKRNSVMEAIGSPSPLPRSIVSDSDSTADSHQIDLTGKTQSEVLTLTIDTALARLVRLVSNNEPIAASTLTKIVSDLTDAYRKLLSIPQEVMDALGELGRLQGILQRTNAERPDSSPETLRSFFKAVCDHIEDDTKQLASGEGVVTSDRGTVRNPDWSSATIGELVEELLAVPIMWNEWIHVQ